MRQVTVNFQLSIVNLRVSAWMEDLMEATYEEHIQERAVLVGLNADCFTKE